MSRCSLMLVASGLFFALCGCPGETPSNDGGDKPAASQQKPDPKPSPVEPAGPQGGATRSGTPVAFSVGVDSNRDPGVAARRATEEAIENLGIPVKGIVFCQYFPETVTAMTTDQNGFESQVEHERPDPERERMVLSAVREAVGDVPTIGCRARALVRDGTGLKDTVAVLAIGGDDVTCRAVKARLADDRATVGAAIAAGLGKVEDLKLAMVLSDRELAYNEKPGVSADDFMRGLLAAIGEGTVAFGGIGMPTDDPNAAQGGVFLGDESLDGHVVALGIGGPIGVHAAVAHEFSPAEKACGVTKTDGKWIEQLDGRPAAEVYREIRGMEPDDEFTRDGQHPIGLATSDEETCLRMVLDEDKPRGALRFITPIDQDTEVKVMYGGGDAGAILESADRAVVGSLDKLGDARPLALLLADADARGQRLRQFREEGACAVKEAILPAVQKHQGMPIFGFCTFGEFGPNAMLGQHSVVSVVLCEE